MSNKRVRMVLLASYFLSGASALIYQIAWVRMFGLVFGVTIFAVSTVLTTFMAGLALGSYSFGRWIDKRQNPLVVFACLELGIGLFALAFPSLFHGLSHIYIFIHQRYPTSFYSTSLIRFALSFLLLIVPATLMGGTLPVLSKFFVTKLKQLGWDIGHLYSANNLGAVVGVCLAGFFLIQTIGMTATVYLAAAVNLLIGLSVLLMRRSLRGSHNAVTTSDDHTTSPRREESPSGQSALPYPRYVVTLALWAFAIEGFTTLSYEVIWTRILVGLSPQKTVHLFSTIVISFILGLAIGSFIAARLIDRAKNLLTIFGFLEMAIGALGILLLPIFAGLPAIVTRIYAAPSQSWLSTVGIEHLLFLLLMILPTIAMGATFPIVGKIYTRSLKGLGRRIGNIGCLDTIGSIFGAFVAGFVLIPFVGVRNAVVITAVINLIIGAVLIFVHPYARFGTKAATAVLFLSVIAFTCFGVMPGTDLTYLLGRTPDTTEIYYREGIGATIAVLQKPNGVKAMLINGAYTAFSNYQDMRVHQMLAYLPSLLHKDPQNALVIGLGMGVTADSLMQPGIKEVDCVEISPAVLEASDKCFARENHEVLRNPRLNVILDDGRSHLLITKKRYDIITSNAVHARLSPNLYTSDFYRICKNRLTEDGVMCQWLPTNWMSEDEYKMLIRAFIHVFPHTSLWFTNAGHTLLVGTPQKISLDFGSFEARLRDEQITRDLSFGNLDQPAAFLAHYIAADDNLAAYISGVPMNSDDHPRVEFSRVVSRRVPWSVIHGLLAIKEDVRDILVNVGSSQDKSAALIDKLTAYAMSSERTILSDLFSSYSMYLDALTTGYAGLRANPEDRHAHAMFSEIAGMFLMHAATRGERGRRPTAMALAGEFVKMYSDSARLFPASGADEDRMYQRAMSGLRQSVDMHPDYAAAHHYLGFVYAKEGMLDEAAAELETAMRLDPNSLEARYHLAMIYADMGRYSDAIAQLEETLRRNPWFELGAFALKELEDKS